MYNKETDRIETEDPVKIISPEMELSGVGLDGNTALKNFKLFKDVSTILQAKGPKKNEKK
jgi:lipopolysaccharide export system protein LptC